VTLAAEGIELPDLGAAVLSLLRQVKRKRVTTYGELARALGDVRAARWVGEFLRDHPHGETCPCHRVVRGTGEVGLYATGDPLEKIARLIEEGIAVEDGRADLGRLMSSAEFRSPAPLSKLIEFQDTVARRLRMTPLEGEPELLCGLDVAYRRDGSAQGAAVLLDATTLDTVWEGTYRTPVAFPYIPGYLAFRELPVLLDLWEQAKAEARGAVACFVDGNGRLHPRRAGVASCFGLLAGVPTIGIGKSLLCGRVDADSAQADDTPPVVHAGEVVARTVRCRESSRPFYVSVGNGLTLDDALRLARRCLTTHRLPEPIHRADRLSKR
jgi:deoxyribonuclease V